MKKGKYLHTITINDYKYKGRDVKFSVFGVFDTDKVHWEYYVISHVEDNNKKVFLTPDLCGSFEREFGIDVVESWGKEFKTKEEGMKFLQEYKDKWEFGSNDTKQENREKKINDVLGGGKK